MVSRTVAQLFPAGASDGRLESAFALLDAAPALVRVSAPGVVFVNARWLSLTGRSLEQCLGGGWTESVHPDDQSRCARRLHSAFERGQTVQLEYRLRSAGGEWCWMKEEASPWYDAGGAPVGLVSAAFENEELKQARSTVERQAAERVAEARRYALRLIDVQESERRRLCAELHDETGEALTALRLKLASLAKQLEQEAPARAADAAECVRLSLAAYDAVSRVLGDLRPPMLDDHGLAAALRWYGERFGRESGLSVSVRVPGEPPRLPPQVESALFRIAQECLRNVVRHAGASRVAVSLAHDGDSATMSVEDDGHGLGAGEATRGEVPWRWGMMTMQERACAIDARLDISSGPGRGVRVTVSMKG